MDKEIENAAFLIEMARMEYEAEFVRSNRIQEKCGIFLSLMGTFLSIVLVSFPYPQTVEKIGEAAVLVFLVFFFRLPFSILSALAL